jgi:uncharacterized membrane protein
MVTIKRLLLTTITFVALDAVWLGVIQRKSLQRFFQGVNCGRPFGVQLGVGLLVWLALAFALERFVFQIARSQQQAILLAALLGGLIYAVYDLTNLATIRAWTWQFALKDIAWGAVVSALVAAVRYS